MLDEISMYTWGRRANVLNASRLSVLPTRSGTKTTQEELGCMLLVRYYQAFHLSWVSRLNAVVFFPDEFSSQDDVNEFFEILGSGSPADLPDESAGGDDEAFEAAQEKVVTLYRVSDASGRMDLSKVSSKPLQQSALDTNDCFILDTTDANIYVWVGKKCNNKERNEAMSKAQNFLTAEHYPSWTQVQRIVEGAEPSIFQQYFQTWKTAGQLHSRLIRSVDEEPRAKEEVKSAGEAPEFMPDDGSGEVEIFRVENFELVPVDAEAYGKFFGGDSYVIKYQYGSKYIIYMWQVSVETTRLCPSKPEAFK